MTTKKLITFASVSSLVLILGAYYFEFIGGFSPCKLCYWQRYPHFLVILIFPLFYFLPGLILIFVGIASMLASTVLAFYHVGVERKYWPGPNSCTTSSIEGLTTDQLLDQIMSAPLVRCDEIAWSFIGVSMAGWNALISFCLFLTWSYCYLKKEIK
tara:strand:+ start:140 stop:607 length:468 start_codon:yes stop_codon:yes gene_type:complete